MAAPVIHLVDPARLAHGMWSHEQNRQMGEGDIAASYSADRIGMDRPIRKPFSYRGALWVNVSNATFEGLATVWAYQIVPLDCYDGQSVTYTEKTSDGTAARRDPNGFYHGMRVRRAGETYVLVGPPAIFRAGSSSKTQLELFEAG